MSSIQVVTCDVHGTLILPYPSVGAIYATYARGYGYIAEADQLDAAFLPAFKEIRARSLLAYGANQEDARVFWVSVIKACFNKAHGYEPSDQCCRALFYGFAEGEQWRILDNVVAVLNAIKRLHVPLVICSNFDERVRSILSDLELDSYVDDWFISAEMGLAKPDPAIMHAIAKQFGCACDQILHIGNHLREDGQLCAATGAHFLHVDQRQDKPLRVHDFQERWLALNPN